MVRIPALVLLLLPLAAACRSEPAAGACEAESAPAGEGERVLEMKPACERCSAAVAPDGEAYICSYECTFCAECTRAMEHVCPNCGGVLAARPTRTRPARD